MTENEIIKVMENKGYTVECGISWTWVTGIKTYEDAEDLRELLTNNLFENRGIYPEPDETFSIRFR